MLPPVGGDTLFASMYAAYETLSPTLQEFLAGLTATHESEHLYRGRYAERGVDDTGKVYPSAEHPVVRTHPESGRQALYVNPSFTTRINGLSIAESKALLEFLYSHQQRPEFQVRFRWTENAIALWDNRCTQHFALWDYWPHERKGHRVTIKGERPFYRPSPPVQSDLRISQRQD
jgi:taurine dioxygenase